MVNLKTAILDSLEKILEENGGNILTEVKDPYVQKQCIALRNTEYSRRKVQSYSGHEPLKGDPFDESARFFVLYKPHSQGHCISKGLRIIPLHNQLGVLPTELNLLSHDDFCSLSRDYGFQGDNFQEATLTQRSKKRFSHFFRSMRERDEPFYEIGGLFGTDNDPITSLLLILGITKVLYDERWIGEVQTQHPNHSRMYKRIGLPYFQLDARDQTFTHDGQQQKGYLDHCGRPATTLYAKTKRDREKIKTFLESYTLSV